MMRPVGPATQDVIKIVDAQRGMIFLNDGTATAGVQIFSVSEALLTPRDVEMRILSYRDSLLKHVRFPFQWLIGTRPQVLDEHVQVVGGRLLELVRIEIALTTFASKLRAYLAVPEGHGQALFAQHFGLDVEDFLGTPGAAHHVAETLCDARRMEQLHAAGHEPLESYVTECADGIEASITCLRAWSMRLRARTEHLVRFTAETGTPVRTLYLIVSHNPRLVAQAGSMNERELADTIRVLDDRCNQMISALVGVRVRAVRAPHTELLRQIQYFFHPSNLGLASPPAASRTSLARSVLMGED